MSLSNKARIVDRAAGSSYKNAKKEVLLHRIKSFAHKQAIAILNQRYGKDSNSLSRRI